MACMLAMSGLNVKYNNFHLGAGNAHSHVHYLQQNGAARSGSLSVCVAGLKM